MATNLTPVTTPPRGPRGSLFLDPPVSQHWPNAAPKEISRPKANAPLLDLQSPLNRFTPGKSRFEYLAGESIFSQGDPANAVYYIQSGKVNLTVVSASGKEAVIAQLAAGSFFGEASLAGELRWVSSASALESCTIVRIGKSTMRGLLDREPEFARDFRAHLLARIARMQADLVDHLFNSSGKRLARLLMLMANFGQESEPIPVIAKISQQTLADMIGTTRSRVSFFLNRFRSRGYINYDSGGMVINSSLVNIVLQD
jgi:CRP-like cAMP-binding protein